MSVQEDSARGDGTLRQLARWRATARVLVEALPFILQYDNKTIVVKYGGHAMEDGVHEEFAQDVVLMKQTGINPVVVHGGGPQIGAMLKRLNIESSFVDGLRVAPALVVQRADVVVRGGERGVQLQRLHEARERRVVASGGLLADAEVHVRDREPGIELERLREVAARLLVAAAVQRREAAHVPRGSERGFHGDGLLRKPVGFVEAADAMHGRSQVRPAFGHLRRDGERHAQVRDGAAPVLVPGAGDGRLRVRGEIERVEGRWVGHVSFRL